MSELPSPSLPEFSATSSLQPEPHPGQREKKRIMLIGGATIVGIGTLCGLGYAAWSGYLPNPLIKRPTPEQLFAELSAINSAQTTVDVRIVLGARESDVVPLDFSLFKEPVDGEDDSSIPVFASVTQMIPSDLDLNLSITSSFTKEDKEADQETHIEGTYTGNNVSANIDLTTRTVGEITYIRPDAIPLPIPIFDMSALQGTWVNLGEETDDRKVFSSINFSKDDEVVSKDKDATVTNLQTELFALVQQGVKDGAIIFSVPERVTYGETRAWHTEAVIDGEKLRETVIDIGKNRETLFSEITEYRLFTDEFLENSSKERAKDTYRELFKRINLSATTNDDGSPLMIAFSTRLAPKLEEDIFKDRQITFQIEIYFKSVNIPINLTAPEDAISISEAVGLLTGANPNDETRKAQQETIVDLREALSIYMKEHDEYPEMLNELIGKGGQSREVIAIPVDVVTEQPYKYTRTENGYALLYQMPESQDDTFNFYEKTIDGTNTATHLFFSEEGAKLTDHDKDGISLYDEVVTYGTSDNADDSDGDGYSDKVEIDGGYDPNNKPENKPTPRRLF
jgi:hypothetical protein